MLPWVQRLRGIALVGLIFACIATLPPADATPMRLVAAVPKRFPPIYSVSRNNVPTGFGIQFMELVARYADLNIEYRAAPTWPATIALLETKQADLIPNLGITPKREHDFLFSKPYDKIQLRIFVKAGMHDITGRRELNGRRVGVVELNRGETLLQHDKRIHLIVFGSLGALVAALQNGDVDAAVYPDATFQSFTNQLGLHHAFRKVGDPLESVERAIAVRKDHAALLPILNKAIDQAMASPDYRTIYDRWHPPPPPYWNTFRVTLLSATLLTLFFVTWLVYRYRITRQLNSKLEAHTNFIEAMLDATSDGIVTLDHRHRIQSVNTYAETLFGYPEDSLVGMPISDIITGTKLPRLLRYIFVQSSAHAAEWSTLGTYSIQATARRANRDLFPVRLGIATVKGPSELNYVCTIHDESRAYQAERRAEYVLNQDPLTGLLNQRGLFERIEQALANVPDTMLCYCIGLTNLTRINSLYGRPVGDRLLVEAGSALANIFEGDRFTFVARISANRFIVTQARATNPFAETVEALRDAIEQIEVLVDGIDGHLSIDYAIGIAEFPSHARDAAELVANAELAYNAAKRQIHDNVAVYQSDDKTAQSIFEIAHQRIKSALKDGRIALYYQPIQNSADNRIQHFEALVRMFDHDGSLIMPAEIIPVAEQSNLIARLDYTVLGLALEKLAALRERHPEITISINLSASHLADSKIGELLKADMSLHGFDLANLIFEITETAALQNFPAASEFMRGLKSFGCRFALDDFGVGFTSFAQLRALPVDIIKIDGMFIKELHMNKQDQVFVKAMTDVAHSLGKEVVAEFVENEQIAQRLIEYGVDYLQGYFVGKPQPELDLESHAEEHQPDGPASRGKKALIAARHPPPRNG